MSDLTAKAHDLLASRVLMPAFRLQRGAMPSRHRVMRAYYEGLRFRREAAAWDVERKREWVLSRLRFAVRRAYCETDYYAKLFDLMDFDPHADFSFDDFSRLPVLEREDIRRAGRSLLSRTIPARLLRRDATGGSTGTPTEIWLGPEDRGWRESGVEHFMRQTGVPVGTRTGLLWGHHLDPVASARLRDRCYAFATNIRWFDCFRLSPEILERYHREFQQWQPACIGAYASALGSLAEHVLERGHRPRYPTRCFVTGAEKLMPHHRDAVAAAFGKPVHERYGSRDIGSMGFQTKPSATLDYEIDWANVLLEPETSESDSAILITTLHADGMPLIRYRVGDVGRFPSGSRPGHPTLALREVLGRSTDRVFLPDGRWINGIQLPHLLKDHPVREFMLIQRADYSVELKIVPKDGFGDESRSRVCAIVAANLPGLGVSLELVDEIPRTPANKYRPVLSEVQPERQLS